MESSHSWKRETVPIAENVAADGSDNPTGSAANRRVNTNY